MRLTKPWMSSSDALGRLHGNLGVFQLGDAHGGVLFIGFAGGQSLFGLKGAVREALDQFPQTSQVRYEVTTSYHTRYRELLMLHIADFGAVPLLNTDTENITLGKLSPG